MQILVLNDCDFNIWKYVRKNMKFQSVCWPNNECWICQSPQSIYKISYANVVEEASTEWTKKNKMKKPKNIHSVCVRRRGMPNTETETFSIHWIQYCVPQTIWIWINWCSKTSRIWTIRIQWQTKNYKLIEYGIQQIAREHTKPIQIFLQQTAAANLLVVLFNISLTGLN